jgi:hypothetical protein
VSGDRQPGDGRDRGRRGGSQACPGGRGRRVVTVRLTRVLRHRGIRSDDGDAEYQ